MGKHIRYSKKDNLKIKLNFGTNKRELCEEFYDLDELKNDNNSNKSNIKSKSITTSVTNDMNCGYYEVEVDELFNRNLVVDDFDIVYCDKKDKIVLRIFYPIESITIKELLGAPDEIGYPHKVKEESDKSTSQDNTTKKEEQQVDEQVENGDQ